MNFEACLSLPREPREAKLIADQLEALARALRDWPVQAWQRVAARESTAAESGGLFDRLLVRTAPAALDPRQHARARASAEAAADVLRVLWPEATAQRGTDDARLVATT